MFINFRETGSPNPLQEFELYLGETGQKIYWPTKNVYEYSKTKVKTTDGINKEAQGLDEITDKLCDMFKPSFDDTARTRLEIQVALTDVIQRKLINTIKDDVYVSYLKSIKNIATKEEAMRICDLIKNTELKENTKVDFLKYNNSWFGKWE